MPQYRLSLPARALARFHAIWLLAALALSVPARADDQEEFDPPLITAAERLDFDRNVFRQYQTALQQANPSSADAEVLRHGARYHLYGLTMEEIRNHLPTETDDLIQEIEGALATENARRVICQEIVDRAPELLPGDGRLGQPHIVRLNLAIMLRRLNSVKAGGQQPAIPFVPARTAMLLILNDPGNTRTEARIWAAEGLGRICEFAVPGVTDGDLTIVQRSEIGLALVQALESDHAKDDPTRFYATQIMDALGDCSLSRDITDDPILIKTLLECVGKAGESDLVRSEAALAISRLGRASANNGLGAPINFPLIMHDVMHYLRDVAVRLKTGAGPPADQIHYRRAIMNVYFSFNGERPPIAAEQDIGFLHQIERAGLTAHRDLVESAYAAALPIFQEVASNPQAPVINNAMIEALDDWLEGHPPADRLITPDSEPLPEPNAQPAANNPVP